ncbi:dicarboxylate/amino acid:cation symporter [Kineococcus gynurae]|uniref:L-cystine uptake protein TcyP n=1 Tax=Kineococcus gynurae TaxID=452979 RepID=A0ABV5LVJ5_9ACTN
MPRTLSSRRSIHPATLIGAGAVGGVVFGLLVGGWAANVAFVGDIFIRLVQMAIVPLVMTSVIVATGSMAGAGTGRLAFRTFRWMVGFSVVAAGLAVLLSEAIRPGEGMVWSGPLDPELEESATGATGWQETLTGFVSTNVVESMASAAMVPIIVFSLLLGVALNEYVTRTGNRLVLDVAEQFQQVVLGLVKLVMRVAPVGVFCLLAPLAGEVGFEVVTTALKYLGTTAAGVAVLTLLFVATVAVRARVNPFALPRKLAEQTAVAVTTTSSAVTFPTVLRTTIDRLGVSPRVANFVLSIGLTMGSYGAVLNYTVVVFFLAQAGGIDLGPGQIAFGMVLAILLNMGTITVPGGFPVVALFLATSLELPLTAVGLLIAVDWFTGMLRTFLNVNGDTFVALLVAGAEGELDRDVLGNRETSGASVTRETITLPADEAVVDREVRG